MDDRTDKANAAYRAEVVRALADRDGDGCWYCGDSFGRVGELSCTIEHLIPVAAGGPRWSGWNLAIAHLRCNGMAADARLEQKLALRDALRAGGGFRAISSRQAREAIGCMVTRRQRRKQRCRRRAELRWRFRASGAPGTARRPFASIGEIAGLIAAGAV